MKKLFFLVTLLMLAASLAAPAGSATAGGANQVDFTATSVNFCAGGGVDPFCKPGELVFVPNGKFFVVGYQTIMKFTATDPRWTADCYYVVDPMPPASGQVLPAKGSFTCYPTDPQYVGGWWAGTVRNIFHPEMAKGEFNGKGYGKLEGLLVTAHGEMGADGAFYNVGTIIELPGYEP